MTGPPINSPEFLESRIDELVLQFVAASKDRSMLRIERWRTLQRLTNEILVTDGRLERALRDRETADVIGDLAETPREESS